MRLDRRLAVRAGGKTAEQLAVAVDELGAAGLIVVAAAPRASHPHLGITRHAVDAARVDSATADFINPSATAAWLPALALILS